ncbi:beta-lactamase-like protein [Aspergillus pseudocaelatus]|uniref:Beta-lactamase-like protein n=1 Tax=Aspergillus pseudocaelatus TaxID=1825620 RepID=A0ABQ6WLZ1_9EURO|nr:beta-lactamase-like protein [Aspergillus pseudocaelatus]
MISLRADVYVSSRLPIAVKRAGTTSKFSAISCTLIQGEKEVVLDLVQWIKETAPGKELTFIYITHGHGDHWFGLPVLKKYWPNVHVLATPGTVAHMKQQTEPAVFEDIWLRFFPGGQIAQPFILAEEMSSPTFMIEGHEFNTVEVGHTDTYDTTVLHVPDIHLVVAEDVVYGDVHQVFGEATTPAKRQEWLRALDKIVSLNPHMVIAGHKRAGTVDGVFNVKATREYILAFDDPP